MDSIRLTDAQKSRPQGRYIHGKQVNMRARDAKRNPYDTPPTHQASVKACSRQRAALHPPWCMHAAIMTWRTKACKGEKRQRESNAGLLERRPHEMSYVHDRPIPATDLGATKAEAPAAHAKTIAQADFMVSEVDLAQS